ncbi:MAG: adenine deaminase [Candidatus Freyarchaeota archaeon]|nr:adenine deaminase [Candidatus Jordarchaeia archaeon]MBS7270300.1 adenine deaminase [Candidatus Jordarchaeia archaeon]MBS7281000.1 adenine deaminase [Candidatus Jordarchaeia archaeon]
MEEIIKTALGELKADLVIKNTSIINVCTSEIEQGDIAIKNNKIALVGDASHTIGEKTRIIEGEDKFASPGFFDAHVHVESSEITITEFTKACLLHGTTSIIWDPHEIANVRGVDGVKEILEESKRLPLNVFVMIPSCVPATSPKLGTSGATITVKDILKLSNLEGIMGLGEVMNFPGVLNCDEEVLDKIKAAKKFKAIDGHAPGLRAEKLCAYFSTGIRSDHESVSGDEGLEKLRRGVYLVIREGTASKNLASLIRPIIEMKLETRHCLLATDDISPEDLKNRGEVDYLIRRCIEEGLDSIKAYQMATLNPACYLGIDHMFGSITPGKNADIVLLRDLKKVKVATTIVSGVPVVVDGKLEVNIPQYEYSRETKRSVNVGRIPEPEKFQVKTQKKDSQEVKVIGASEGTLFTSLEIEKLKVEGGVVMPDSKRDVLQVAVVERHHASGDIGKGFVKGFGLKEGSIASTVAHDSHNIVVVGTNWEDMARAVLEIVEMQGGMVAVKRGECVARLTLNFAGLMSTAPIEEVIQGAEKLKKAVKAMGCKLEAPFMTLSFLSLPVIPELKITEKGLIDVINQEITSVLV